jgi:hypothetical protein
LIDKKPAVIAQCGTPDDVVDVTNNRQQRGGRRYVADDDRREPAPAEAPVSTSTHVHR